MKIQAILSFCVLIFLTSCGPSKTEINAKLAKGCEAAVSYALKLSDSDYTYSSLIAPTFDREVGTDSVKVTIEANVMYREYSEEEESYVCVFYETKNLIKHNAEIDYVDVEDQKYGKVNFKLTNMSIGEYSEFSESVRVAMR